MSISERTKYIMNNKPEAGVDITSWESWRVQAYNQQTGFQNAYKSYETMVAAVHKKYRAGDNFGNTTLISIINLQTAFISGEGISTNFDSENKISEERQKAFVDFKNSFFRFNNEPNGFFTDLHKRAVKCGKLLVALKVVKKRNSESQNVKIIPIHCDEERGYEIILKGDDLAEGFTVKLENQTYNGKEELDSEVDNLHYVILGDPSDINKPVYKAHGCLTEIENYDRGLKDMRRLNYCGARVTPAFHVKTGGQAEVNQTAAQIQEMGWKIGDIWVGTAELSYVSPKNTAAIDGLLREIEVNGQTISAITNIPIHWFGFVNLMSNRSVAESLYDMINTGTKDERNKMSDFFYDILVNAQTLTVDQNLIEGYKTVEEDISVKIPVIDFSNFKNILEPILKAHDRQIISTQTVQGMLPGIDPTIEKQRLDQEEEEENVNRSLDKSLTNSDNIDDEDFDDDVEDDEFN